MKFNSQQEKAINSIKGNIAVIATAGSGKTAVLTYRIKNMINNHNCNPSSILAITFSKKAKDNIETKLERLKTHGVNVETFHSLALKIIASACGANRYKVWTAQCEREKSIQNICVSLGLCSFDNVPLNDIFSFIALQKINMLKPTDDLIYCCDLPFSNDNMKQIYSLYEKGKELHSYIEFDDFLNMANELLDTDHEILELYKNKFQYVLVDEFQDVSLSQALLIKKINQHNTMVVGDPLQAIYSFRGGDSKYILNFDTEYENTEVINLNINYRSSKNIIKAANQLALFIPDSKHRNYIESIAHKDEYQNSELYHFNNEYDESLWVAHKISELKEKYSYNDIAVLARTNAQLQKLETTLHNLNITFNIVDGQLFSELPEIKLILSYLRLALYENDDSAFRYLYNKPNRWLNKKFLKEVEKNSIKKDIPLYTAMFTIDRRNWRFKGGIDEISEVIHYLQNKEYSTVADLIRYLRKRLDIDDFVTKGKQSDDGKYVEQIENLDSFENLCEKYTSVKQLLSYIDDLNSQVNVNKDESVKLLTIHKSKGLEFPVVFEPAKKSL